MSNLVHFSHKGSQPYIAILCREEEGIVHYVCSCYPGMETGSDGVYRADDNAKVTKPHSVDDTFLYTFRHNLVTCPDCLKKLKE